MPADASARRVLVTGATGFLGRPCSAALLERGFEVHALTSRPGAERSGPTTWHVVDLFDDAAVQDAMASVRPSHLLHLAWDMIPGQYQSSAGNVSWVRASLGLLEAFARAGGQRAVFIGSCFEYDLRHGFCSEAVTPLRAANAYGRCKHALAQLVEEYAEQAGISTAWARVFFSYGPHEHPSRLVASVANAVLRSEPARSSHGNQVRDYLHTTDIAEALAALLASGVTGPVNIASGQGVRLRDIVLGVAAEVGREDLVALGALEAPADEPPLVVGDVRRLANEVGWQPRITLADGLASTVAWWAEQLGADSPSGPNTRRA